MILPNISVIITTYNRAKLLPQAIESVLAQTYGNYDIHIVDDCSSDTTRQVVESMVAGRENIHYWRHESNKGLSAARNTGISHSSGEYIAFLDDDDEWKPQSLQRRSDLLEELSSEEISRMGVVYTGCEIRIEDENRVSFNMPKLTGNIRQAICSTDINSIPSTCMFPREVLKQLGGFDERLLSSIDHDIWMNLANHNYCAYAVNEPLTITYQTKNHRCMTTETTSRIHGVEQYLNKWRPTFEQWFGRKKGRDYVRKYRIRVLGNLAGIQLGQGSFRQAYQLVRHIIRKDKNISLNQITLIKMVVLSALRECMPFKLKRILRNMIGSIRKYAC